MLNVLSLAVRAARTAPEPAVDADASDAVLMRCDAWSMSQSEGATLRVAFEPALLAPLFLRRVA